MTQYNIADFTSAPNYTMEDLRRDQTNKIGVYLGYVKQMIAEARQMGLEVDGTLDITVTAPNGIPTVFDIDV